MRQMLWAVVAGGGIAVALGGAAGCRHQQPPATQPVAAPATAETARQIREEYQKRDPSAVVGLVIAVLPESKLASVGDVPVNEFQPGQLVTFIDSDQTIIAVGNVVNVLADAVHVKYHEQGDGGGGGGRAPREGDLAVKVGS